MRNQYRIVVDDYAGFEAQFKPWWFPLFWWQCYGTNTRSTIEEAEKIAMLHSLKLSRVNKVSPGRCIKNLGRLPPTTQIEVEAGK
jgi:hypothetical protein